MSKRQATLGAFGFTKTVTHRGSKVSKLEINHFSMDKNVRKIPCPYCDRKFINQQELNVYLKFVHPAPDLTPASDYLQR